MIRSISLGLFAMMLTANSANAHQQSAAVAVVFDRDTARPVIVEGLADRETGRVVEANDPVRIASISKLIMALTVMRVVEEDPSMLHADVSSSLGWKVRNPAFPETKVTLLQLLSHRSGLRDANGYVIPMGESLEHKLADPASWYADAPPGKAPFEYANLGSPVVATVLEAMTGQRYDQLVQREIFNPLGIKGCLNWLGCSQEMSDRAVILYRDTGEVARDDALDRLPNCTIPVADGADCDLANYVPGTNASIFSPQGGVRIGMMDLARIGQEMIRTARSGFVAESVLNEVNSAAMGNSDEQEFFCIYGAGFQTIQALEGDCNDHLFGDNIPYIGHAGEAYGLRSGLWFTPLLDTGIAYFITAAPPRQHAEDEGGFDPREVEFVRRAMTLSEKPSKSVQETPEQD